MTELQPKIDGMLAPSYPLPLFEFRVLLKNRRKTNVSVGKIYLDIEGLHVSFRPRETRQLRKRVSVYRFNHKEGGTFFNG